MRDSSSVPPTMTNEQNQDIREIQNAIDLSFQAEAFLKSPLGQYLIKRCEEKVEEALDKLKYADPSNSCLIRSLQHNIHVGEDIQYFLAECIQAGINAAENFTKEQ